MEMSQTLDKLPHTYTEQQVEPTCTEAGYTRFTCPCGHSYDDERVTATGHHLKQTVTKPTCETAGYTRYTCDCGFTYTGEQVPSKGHTLTAAVVAPTCEVTGYTRYACACGYTYDAAHTAPLGHTLTETVVAPTCEEAGYTRYTCDCGYTYDADHTAPLGHTLTETVVPPTCEEAGYTRYTCACSYTYDTDYVAPLGHTLAELVTLPTCETEGHTHYACANCDYAYDSDFVMPMGHAVVAGEPVPATCVDDGYTHYGCERCDYGYDGDFVMAMGEHANLVVEMVYPTIHRAEGYTLHRCTDCEYEEKTDFVQYADIYSGAYVSNTEVLKRGIDVSMWNHTYTLNGEEQVWKPLDWEALAAAGVEFVILKAGSTNGIDPTFDLAYEGAKAAGLEVGAYFFTYATTAEEALADAEMMLTWLEGKQFELPIYFDLEDDTVKGSILSGLEQDVLMDMCTTFIGRLQEAGYYAALYTNTEWLYALLNTEWIKENLDVWYARYTKDGAATDGFLPWIDTEITWKDGYASSTILEGHRFGIWQYTQIGRIDGFTLNFDFNLSFKDYKPLMEQWGLNGF